MSHRIELSQGFNYAGTAADTGTDASGASATAWVTPANATGRFDGVYTTSTWAVGGATSNGLKLTNFKFNLPPTAIIDGIEVAIVRQGSSAKTAQVNLVKAGVIVASSAKTGADTWPGVGSEGTVIYGGTTDTWGNTWTGADLNSSTFGAVVYAQNTTGGGEGYIDAVAVGVFWHAAPTNLPRQTEYLYRVYDGQTNQYLGNLPNVSSPFQYSQDINTAGSQITVTCGISTDTSALPVSSLTDEAGANLTDESSSVLTNEGVSPSVGIGTSSAFLRDGNKVEIIQYDYYNANGTRVFYGIIDKIAANYGGDSGDNNVSLLIYSQGYDLGNHLVKGNPITYTLDQSQTASDANGLFLYYNSVNDYEFLAQSFTVGGGVTNIGMISVKYQGPATGITCQVWDQFNTSSERVIGSSRQLVGASSSPTTVQFVFGAVVPVTPGKQYFFTVTPDFGTPSGTSSGGILAVKSSDVYAGGAAYYSSPTFGAGSNWIPVSNPGPSDLYFQTFRADGSTAASYSGIDPVTMLNDVLSQYISEGGGLGYTTQASGLSVNYSFNTSTVAEAVSSILTLVPSDYYYYADLGNIQLNFIAASTTADITLTKGVHINKLSIISTTEYVVNTCYVVGAAVSGSNIYTGDSDAASVALYGPRIQVHSDGNIKDATTAHIVGAAIVAANKDEQYQTTVTILAKTMDITTIHVGQIVGFNGFGTYVDNLLSQIVHIDYTPEQVTCTLGILPKRTTTNVEQVVRSLTAISTSANPNSPS